MQTQTAGKTVDLDKAWQVTAGVDAGVVSPERLRHRPRDTGPHIRRHHRLRLSGIPDSRSLDQHVLRDIGHKPHATCGYRQSFRSDSVLTRRFG